MSCADGTGCDCGNYCGDDSQAVCDRPAKEAVFVVKVDCTQIPATVVVTKDGVEGYRGTDPFEVMNTIYA